MTSKRAAILIAGCVFATVHSGPRARATITDVGCSDLLDNPLPAEVWNFDYDLQVVTITVPIYDIGRPSFPNPSNFVWVGGLQDSQSVLTVTENIINETGVPLTGYNLYLNNTVGTYSEIVVGTVQATGSPEVRWEDTHYIELVWSEPIPNGGGFTIQFDILNFYYGIGYRFGLDQAVVPEPTTIAFWALGALVATRTTRRTVSRAQV